MSERAWSLSQLTWVCWWPLHALLLFSTVTLVLPETVLLTLPWLLLSISIASPSDIPLTIPLLGVTLLDNFPDPMMLIGSSRKQLCMWTAVQGVFSSSSDELTCSAGWLTWAADRVGGEVEPGHICALSWFGRGTSCRCSIPGPGGSAVGRSIRNEDGGSFSLISAGNRGAEGTRASWCPWQRSSSDKREETALGLLEYALHMRKSIAIKMKLCEVNCVDMKSAVFVLWSEERIWKGCRWEVLPVRPCRGTLRLGTVYMVIGHRQMHPSSLTNGECTIQCILH